MPERSCTGMTEKLVLGCVIPHHGCRFEYSIFHNIGIMRNTEHVTLISPFVTIPVNCKPGWVNATIVKASLTVPVHCCLVATPAVPRPPSSWGCDVCARGKQQRRRTRTDRRGTERVRKDQTLSY